METLQTGTILGGVKPPQPKKKKNKKKNKKKSEKEISEIEDEENIENTTNNNNNSISSESDSSEDEGTEGYKKGGYHPVKVGEFYKNRTYQIVKKLGWGHFSTVWLVSNAKTQTEGAMKIVRSAKHYTEAAKDEIKILQKITQNDPNNSHNVVHLIDEFEHRGPNGKHVAMVFEKLGSNLLELIKAYEYNGIPLKIVKAICKQVLKGLAYLHEECQVIHTDLKPENVLLYAKLNRKKKTQKEKKKEENSDMEQDESGSQNSEGSEMEEDTPEPKSKSKITDPYTSSIIVPGIDPADPSTWKVKTVDFGNACWIHEHFTSDIQTRQYRAPEVILGAKYDASVDLWSMACMAFELATGDLLFDPKEGHGYDKNDDHLAQMIELLGKIPKKIATTGNFANDFFDRRGELKYIRKFRMWDLKQVLQDKYHWPEKEAKEMADFCLPMLKYSPEERATASEMLKHPWLADVPSNL